eukprot:1634401-Amphidinium_carterae.1
MFVDHRWNESSSNGPLATSCAYITARSACSVIGVTCLCHGVRQQRCWVSALILPRTSDIAGHVYETSRPESV